MILDTKHAKELISPTRSVKGAVRLYDGLTLLNTFSNTDALSSFTVSRIGEQNKFFGFGVCQEIEVKLLDKDRAINITEEQVLRPVFTVDNSTIETTPVFYISEVKRDENTNELTIKGYDLIYQTKNHTVAELDLVAPYTVIDVIDKIAELLDINNVVAENDINIPGYLEEYIEGANFDGTETIREVLDAIAEVTQSIYYIDYSGALVFKLLNNETKPDLKINKSDYFTLQSKDNRTLADICSATELGDNVVTTTGIVGETQYIRDNPFWDMRDDVDIILDEAIAIIGGLTINQFNCKWRGNYLLEPGDKIELVTKDDNTVTSFLINDKYTYNGGLVADTSWEYGDSEGESANNPTTLGEALKQTYAKVDKANKEIEIVATETSKLKVTATDIQAAVTKLDSTMNEVQNRVDTKMSAEDVNISITKALENGVDKITTTTGFTFNDEGLHISKSNSDITTTINEDGMKVYKNNAEVLVADNQGVRAEDLHATTYLIIGNNSRFEDYDSGRTGCFWIGN